MTASFGAADTSGGMPGSSSLILPVVPLRGSAIFPGSVAPIVVGRRETIRIVEQEKDSGNSVVVVAQRDPEQEEARFEDLHTVGTTAVIIRVSNRDPTSGALLTLVESLHRVRLLDKVQDAPCLKARVVQLTERAPSPSDPALGALVHSVREGFKALVKEAPQLPDELAALLVSIEDAGKLADFIAPALSSVEGRERQELLEMLDVRERLQRVLELLARERKVQRLRNKIQTEVNERLSKQQREILLREQMQAIRKELGEDGDKEIDGLRARLTEAVLPPEAQRRAMGELARLRRIPAVSPERTIVTSYLEWIADLPWTTTKRTAIDLSTAERLLDREHYGLGQVKQRILEFLAVRELKGSSRGSILCLVGPPGVGKTSLGKSIAAATGRAFQRISLGGMHDEVEIRGHRRTYIGALPGQIIQGMRRARSRDPVFMLDEIDKLGRSARGDPAAALLEVLDPDHNDSFRDNYLDLPFDLSEVLFIATANTREPIPSVLRDRMETIELSGYVDRDKRQITRRFLVPRQMSRHGLDPKAHLEVTDEAIDELIVRYTREAGVRLLEQRVAALCRRRAKRLLAGDGSLVRVDRRAVRDLLGPGVYQPQTELARRAEMIGVSVALAYTPAGGEILFVEASRMKSRGARLTITGQVRPVMHESALAAFSWLRASAERYGIDAAVFNDHDVHVHVPAGSIPKDGPSAGVALIAALLSLFVGRPVRSSLAMSGEVTLSGVVLPVGGVLEKVLAAHRSGISTIILPCDNREHVCRDVPEDVRAALEIHYVDSVDDAIERAFDFPRQPGDDGDGRPEPQGSRPERANLGGASGALVG